MSGDDEKIGSHALLQGNLGNWTWATWAKTGCLDIC
jgi:hypothetical protein